MHRAITLVQCTSGASAEQGACSDDKAESASRRPWAKASIPSSSRKAAGCADGGSAYPRRCGAKPRWSRGSSRRRSPASGNWISRGLGRSAPWGQAPGGHQRQHDRCLAQHSEFLLRSTCWRAAGWCGSGGSLLGEDQFSKGCEAQAIHRRAVFDLDFAFGTEELCAAPAATRHCGWQPRLGRPRSVM